MASQETRKIVIIGGAYYISRHPSFSPSTTVTILEASAKGVAQGASGKAGGLIAKWAYPREIVDVSFREHVKLAEEHNGKDRWGWRFVGCGSWEGRGDTLCESGTGAGQGGKRKSLENPLGVDTSGQANKASRESKGLPDDLTWVREDLTSSYSPMAPVNDTAQVLPYLFTTSMLDLAKENGVQLTLGTATGIDRLGDQVTGVTYHPSESNPQGSVTIPATDVIICAGAWSGKVAPNLPISSARVHSITIQPPPSVTIAPYVLFTEIVLPSSSRNTVSPEIHARRDNEVYISGPGDKSSLPLNVDDVIVDEAACESIRQHVSSISPELRDGVVEKRQACFLPFVTTGGGPIIGAMGPGLFVATGHTCWGICNAPGTGKLMSELVMDGQISSAKIQKLDPALVL
ncbi:FAD dependent oxidoreductase [Athelia psychrophila]|uniref:FAD dependent oxidoreductase n=1 Tax=Athelia psychrophila TaxID=1759441 RepID=A0A166TP08_9AGAM|nr:FAD dependent oxidoreductase [Fibularhizoctonia sp. CBS 109695]